MIPSLNIGASADSGLPIDHCLCQSLLGGAHGVGMSVIGFQWVNIFVKGSKKAAIGSALADGGGDAKATSVNNTHN